jgi:hypothetical protein
MLGKGFEKSGLKFHSEELDEVDEPMRTQPNEWGAVAQRGHGQLAVKMRPRVFQFTC